MAFEIEIAETGHKFPCEPNVSILAAGLAAGYMLPYNCRSGLCRSCRSQIVSGTIEYPRRPLLNYLSEKEEAEGYSLICQAYPRSDLVVDAKELVDLTVLPSKMLPSRIIEMETLAPSIMRLKLRLPMNENLRYAAGQHLSIHYRGGVQREYSIANAAGPAGVSTVELHVRHTPGGVFTDDLFSGAIKLRTILNIEVPLGTFFVRESSGRPIIMLATGTGFAPLKAMMENLIARKVHERRRIAIYWGARQRHDLYMLELAQGWAAQHPNIDVVPILSRPSGDCAWEGATGFVQDRAAVDYPDMSQHEVYACGSPAMVRSARELLVARCGLAPDNYYGDEFLTGADKQQEAA